VNELESLTVTSKATGRTELGTGVTAAGLGAIDSADYRQPMTRLLDLRAWMSDDLAELEKVVRTAACPAGRKTHRDTTAVARAAEYILGLPGKRIRPTCVLLGARLGGRPFDEQVCDLAVACELVHAATLLHDDVLDEGDTRRGAPAARVVFGNPASVLGGDLLLLRAVSLVQKARDWRLLQLLTDTMNDMVNAEAIQLDNRGGLSLDQGAYLEVIQGKTAGLFRWAFAAGGIISGMSADEVTILGKIGDAIGLGFQLMDDVLDVSGAAEVLGKAPLADLREGKMTWPYLIAAERNPELLRIVHDYIEASKEGRTPSAEPVMAAIIATGALDETKAFALEQAEIAQTLLRTLPDSVARDAIGVVIDAAVERNA